MTSDILTKRTLLALSRFDRRLRAIWYWMSRRFVKSSSHHVQEVSRAKRKVKQGVRPGRTFLRDFYLRRYNVAVEFACIDKISWKKTVCSK